MRRPTRPQRLLEELSARQRHDPTDPTVRLAVRLRARGACEYCLLPTVGQFHVDHVIPLARWREYAAGRLRAVEPVPLRQGPDHLDNLAWCCPFCNTAKADHVASRSGRVRTRLFDPRRDHWQQHLSFVHNYLFLVGVTDIGRTTEEVLGLNDSRLGGPLGTRHDLILVGRYPPRWARAWLDSGEP